MPMAMRLESGESGDEKRRDGLVVTHSDSRSEIQMRMQKGVPELVD